MIVKRSCNIRLLCLALVLAPVSFRETRSDERVPDFNRDIRPLLSDRCFFCHGPDEAHRKADLRLDQITELTDDRNGTPLIVAHRPEESELLQRVTNDDPDLKMPPVDSGKSLTADEVNLIRRWIASGAEANDHWAFVAPQDHPTPRPKLQGWSRNWIDEFILARLETEGLTPSADADAVTLIRRVHFDLTGLPPSVEVVEAWRADPSEKHFQQIVDRLLASDACAERLAMYWLDLVRFADTVGYHGDQDHNISPYRDWVIDAFASNTPFDQFTREQLAGDLLPESSVDQKIASGYNRLLQTSHEGGVQKKEYLAIYAADRVRNLSAVWMGATVGCAECHDHKYDPYTSRDFYSLAAFFADLDEDAHFTNGGNSLPTRRDPELPVLTRRERQQLESLEQQLADVRVKLAESPSSESLRQLSDQLERAVSELNKSARLTMISVSKEPRTMRVLRRGNWLDDSGPVVEPAVPAFQHPGNSSGRRMTRLDLADWLTSPTDGNGLLTARVFANRFWFLLFGSGLAEVLDDFGGQGRPPDHPELLDRLALEFVQSGWDVRHMLRLMVLSRSWQQSSAIDDSVNSVDPNNRLYSRQNAWRMPAEMIRDNALAISGLLNRKVGGPSVRPYQPAGYYRLLNFPKRTYTHHDDERQWRRGLYVHWQRQYLHPMLKAFDAPSREECTAQRPQSNTPLAALVLLNDPTFVEASEAFAQRIVNEAGSSATDDRIQYAMLRTVSRRADEKELTILRRLLERSKGDNDEDDAVSLWLVMARALLNLDETITRS